MPSSSSSLRIIGGEYRSRKIYFQLSHADNKSTHGMLRPSGSRIREALFNWLSYDIMQARVLDLFAGSGVLGFESLSRGADEVVFVEKQSFYTKQIEDNGRYLACQDSMQVVNEDALLWLDGSVKELSRFSIIFVDPPFAKNYYEQIFKRLLPSIDKNCLVYVECAKNQSLLIKEKIDCSKDWRVVKEAVKGNVYSLLFKLA